MALLDKLRISEQTRPDTGEEIGEEIVSEYAQDPIPNEPAATRGKASPAPRTPKSPRRAASPNTTKLAKEVAQDMGSMIELASVAWGMRDQCCAPVLAEQAQPIATAITNILARNPALLEKFANTDIAVYTMQTMALFTALAPVARSVYSNHISKAGHGDQASGGVDLDQFPSYDPAGANGHTPSFTDFSRD
jgi:hypothetical protein